VTAIYGLPKPISGRFRFRSKPVVARAIKAIIPTCRDWDGLRVTLESLLNLKTPPKEIAVANDNAERGAPAWLASYPVKLVDYEGNLGPAKARNLGFGLRDELPFQKVVGPFNAASSGAPWPDYLKNGFCPELRYQDHVEKPKTFEWNSGIDWYYFTDCGCTHDPDLFLRFEQAWRECGDCCVAITGPVTGSAPGAINDYMTEQGILNPPVERIMRNFKEVKLPQAIVTANALVAGLPFAFVGGFDPQFTEAAGEDLDLGIRLHELGEIAWAEGAKAAHRFEEDESDFSRRFRRYGRGNRRLELKHGLPNLRPHLFKPEKPEHARLAELSIKAMQDGYDEAIDPSVRGVLRIVSD
jgi:glycosyltransferase involved in cell wall biosynthesis